MADQKTEDSKSPLARRGARPFAGPTGAPASARPFVRPATTQRATAAPFIPPVVPGKLALGNVAPAPAAKPATPVATQSVPSADADAMAPRSRPVTSEMVALDAIDAFDAVWGVPESSRAVSVPEAGASPLDESSLGNGIDGQQLWAEEITAASDIAAAEPEGLPAAATSESAHATPAGTMPAWLEDDAAPVPAPTPTPVDSEMTSLAAEVPPPPTAAWSVTDMEGGYAIGEWTDLDTIPASDEIMGVPPEGTAEPALPPSLGDTTPESADWTADEVLDTPEVQPRFELVEEPPVEGPHAPPVKAPTSDVYAPRETRIAATLDRLADRVRSGEIDVSSIAPDATDAAVLASVLAALLRGSSSR